MQNRNIQKFLYHLRHQYATTNNAVIAAAAFIAISWAWGSVSVMERNYQLEREINDKQQQLKLVQLETDTLKYEQNYYQSDEYKELAARRDLGLVKPGEKVLILPPNTKAAEDEDKSHAVRPQRVTSDNFKQWINFLTGRNTSSDLQE